MSDFIISIEVTTNDGTIPILKNCCQLYSQFIRLFHAECQHARFSKMCYKMSRHCISNVFRKNRPSCNLATIPHFWQK